MGESQGMWIVNIQLSLQPLYPGSGECLWTSLPLVLEDSIILNKKSGDNLLKYTNPIYLSHKHLLRSYQSDTIFSTKDIVSEQNKPPSQILCLCIFAAEFWQRLVGPKMSCGGPKS